MHDEAATRTPGAAASATSSADRSGPASVAAQEAIRLRAYQKWEAAGKPASDGVEFWLAAEKELLRHRSRTRTWWTHIQPWIVPPRLRFFRRERVQGS
jgi:hypothetical protein